MCKSKLSLYLQRLKGRIILEMDIKFDKRTLEKCSKDQKYGIRKLGDLRWEIFMKRIGDITAAESLEDLRYVPGHFHELVGDLKGYWACSLDGLYRLLFTPQENPIPTDEDGKYIWAEIKGIIIEEIKDYH